MSEQELLLRIIRRVANACAKTIDALWKAELDELDGKRKEVWLVTTDPAAPAAQARRQKWERHGSSEWGTGVAEDIEGMEESLMAMSKRITNNAVDTEREFGSLRARIAELEKRL